MGGHDEDLDDQGGDGREGDGRSAEVRCAEGERDVCAVEDVLRGGPAAVSLSESTPVSHARGPNRESTIM